MKTAKTAFVLLAALLALLAGLLTSKSANAHEIRPALLTVTRAQDACTVTWKQPLAGSQTVSLTPRLSSGWQTSRPTRQILTGTSRSLTWSREPCTVEDVRNLQVTVEGLTASITNAILIIDDGVDAPRQYVLSADQDSIDLAALDAHGSGWAQHAEDGIFHILTGIDHLAFVLTLMFLCSTPHRILIGLTGFTLGHSVALFLVALKIALPDPQMIEVLVGLSIVVVAVEALKKARHGLAYRYPFAISAGFGVIHGTAYSSAIGLMAETLRANLTMIASFNLGIEIGQILFLAAAGACIWFLRQFTARAAFAASTTLYLAGSYGAFLAISRIASSF